jgi:peptide-methionine (S)-S-oxide reductase
VHDATASMGPGNSDGNGGVTGSNFRGILGGRPGGDAGRRKGDDMRSPHGVMVAAAFVAALLGGLPLASNAVTPPSRLETATFGGGCFWCLEAAFDEVAGVSKVVSGYAGGRTDHPTYKDVCSGDTGHAEVVQITYDPAVVSYDELLDIFFSMHDPTTVDRQGDDVGSQYRSIILTQDDGQQATARALIARLTAEKVFDRPIVTTVEPLVTFFPAEEYHQDYYRRNPSQGYCQVVIAPKMAKFRQQHAQQLKGAR